ARRPRQAEQHQRRVERHRVEAAGGNAHRRARRVAGGDDGHAGGEAAEGVAEFARVDAAHRVLLHSPAESTTVLPPGTRSTARSSCGPRSGGRTMLAPEASIAATAASRSSTWKAGAALSTMRSSRAARPSV